MAEPGPWDDFASSGATAAVAAQPSQSSGVAGPPPWEEFQARPDEFFQAEEQQRIEANAGALAPEWANNAAAALIDTAKGFVPRSVEQAAGMLTPVVGAARDVTGAVKTLGDWVNGKPMEQAARQYFPEAFILKDAEATPAGSKERFAAAFQVLANLGMATSIGRSLARPHAAPGETDFRQPTIGGGEITDARGTEVRGQRSGVSGRDVGQSDAGSEAIAAETARFEEAQRQGAAGEAGQGAGYQDQGIAPRNPEAVESGPWSDYGGPPESARQTGAGNGPEQGGAPPDRPGGTSPATPEPTAGNAPGGINGPAATSDVTTEPQTFEPFAATGEFGTRNAERGMSADPGGFSDSPLVRFIRDDVGGILSRSAARDKWGAQKYEENADLWDDAPALRNPRHNQIYNSRTGVTPDEAATAAVDAGLLPEGAGQRELWFALQKESDAAHSLSRQVMAARANERTAATQQRAFTAAIEQPIPGEKPVQGADLNVGDTVKVGMERMRVTAIDPDTYDVTLEDGHKFGIQHVQDNQAIYGEITKSRVSRVPQAELAPFDPKLRRAEKGTADLFQAQDQPFNLAGEKGIDYAARQRAAEMAARQEAEAAALRERQQQQLFDPKAAVAAPIAPAVSPPPKPGVTMVMESRLPVTMARTGPGTAAAAEVMSSLKRVMTVAGSVGEIRTGRFANIARGIFKPHSEVVRLEHIDNVPTAVHETGHALMKQFYGTIKASGLKVLPLSVRRELISLGKALYGARKPVAGYSGEGFAEFVRLYLTTDDAKTMAPNTNRFFESQVLTKYPEVAAELKKARALIDTYRTQGAIARANTQLVREPGWTRRVTTALRDFFSFQKLAETGMPLRELSEEARLRQGSGGLAPSQDPYKLFKMKRGASGAILDRMVENEMVDVWGNPTGGPSLREALAEVGKDRGEFMLYLFGRRAEERWSKGLNPGITSEDASYLRQTLESPKFDRAASKYYQWWDGVLNYMVQADPRMAETVAAIKKGSSDYAPLARMLDETAVRREAALSQSNPLYRMHGSGLPVKDIFDQTLAGAARLISRANRALVTNAIVKLGQIEGMGRVIEEVPIDKVRRTLNVEQIRNDLEALGLDTSKMPADHVLEYFTGADEPRGSDPIVAYKHADGTTHWYYVDPKLYDSLNGIEPFSLRSVPHMGAALDLALGAPKRLFTLGTTGLRASFSLLTNPLRDPQGWLLQTKAGINPAKMAAAYFQAVAEQLRAAVTGKEGPLSRAAYNLGPQMAQPLGRDIQYTKKASNALFHGRMMRVVTSPIDHLRQLINLPESFPRLAEFKRVGEEIGWKPGDPLSPDQAVELAIAFKEATVDFSASGDVSRIVNEVVPFFNPNIQGIRTAARAFRDHPLRTTLFGLGAFTGPTLLLWWKNKDQEWYRNLPWRERYYYTNIDDGKNVWQIPRPFEWSNLFQVIPEAAFDSWYRQEPRAMTEAVGHIFQTQNPLDYPVLLRVAKEQWQNRLDFWDRPIVPKSEIDLAPGAQVGPYTSRLATWFGKAFPNQISPRRVDAVLRSAGGGTVPDVLDAIGLGSQKQTRESELADTPVLGKLWRRGGFYNAQSQHMADFWDIKTNLDARANAARMEMRDPQRAQNVPTNDPALIMAPVFDSLSKDITQMLRLANQMRESDGRQRLYRQAAAEAKQAVDLYQKQQATLNQSGSTIGQ